MSTGNLSKFILAALISTFSLQTWAAGDSLCVNQEARKYAVQLLNKEQGENKKALTEADVFSKSVIIDNKKQTAFMVYTTLEELVKDVVASAAFHKSGVSEFNYHWHMFWHMPRGTDDHTLLTDLFCKQAVQP